MRRHCQEGSEDLTDERAAARVHHFHNDEERAEPTLAHELVQNSSSEDEAELLDKPMVNMEKHDDDVPSCSRVKV